MNWLTVNSVRQGVVATFIFTRLPILAQPENHAAATAAQLFGLQFHQNSSYTSRIQALALTHRSAVKSGRFGCPGGSLRKAEGRKARRKMKEHTERWMELAKLASSEQDPVKLLELINEINQLLLEKEERLIKAKSAKPEDPKELTSSSCAHNPHP
jgi:hypothetical protein